MVTLRRAPAREPARRARRDDSCLRQLRDALGHALRRTHATALVAFALICGHAGAVQEADPYWQDLVTSTAHEIYLTTDAEAYDAAVVRLTGILEELLVLRGEGPRPDLDPPFAVATMTLVAKGELPPTQPAGQLCRDALPLLSDAERYRGAITAAAFLYGRGDVQSAAHCLEVALASSALPGQHAITRVNLARFQRAMERWETGLASVNEALESSESLGPGEGWHVRALALGERTLNLVNQGALSRAQVAFVDELEHVLVPRARKAVATLLAAGALPREPRTPLEWNLLLHRADLLFGAADPRAVYELVTPALDSGRVPPQLQAFLTAIQGIAIGEIGRTQPRSSRAQYFDRAEEILSKAVEQPGMAAREGLQTELARVDYALLNENDRLADVVLARARKLAEGMGSGVAELEVGALLVATEARVALRRGVVGERLEELDRAMERSFRAFLESWGEARVDGDLAYLRSNRRREIVGRRIALSVALGDAEGALEDLMRVQGYGALARAREVEAPSIEDVRASLIGDEHGVLVYLSAPSGGHVFALDDDGLTHAPLPPGFVVSQTCASLRGTLDAVARGEDAGAFDRAAGEASSMLLPPDIVARMNRWRRVTVVGSVYLFDIPFECLPDPASEDHAWLGESRALDRLSSLPVGAFLAGRPRAELDGGLMMLVSEDPGARAREAYPKLRRIPVSQRDVERMTAPFGGGSVERGVTRQGLMDLDLREAAVVHFMAHGLYETSSVHVGPALVLEPGADEIALLRPSEVRSLALSGVVLLSACEASRGPVYWGNDLGDDLGSAFLEAGAGAVLQTGARVLYEDDRDFMEKVTEGLARGVPLAEASRRAREELGGTRVGISRRIVWARFGVVGLGQR